MINNPNAFPFFKKSYTLKGRGNNTNLMQRAKSISLHFCANQLLFCFRGSMNSIKGDEITFLNHFDPFWLVVLVVVAQAGDSDGAGKGINCRLVGLVLSPHPTPAVLQHQRISLCWNL